MTTVNISTGNRTELESALLMWQEYTQSHPGITSSRASLERLKNAIRDIRISPSAFHILISIREGIIDGFITAYKGEYRGQTSLGEMAVAPWLLNKKTGLGTMLATAMVKTILSDKRVDEITVHTYGQYSPRIFRRLGFRKNELGVLTAQREDLQNWDKARTAVDSTVFDEEQILRDVRPKAKPKSKLHSRKAGSGTALRGMR